MRTITRLVQGKKNPNRVNLYLDDKFAFALSIDEVGKKSLKKGLELSDSEIEELKNHDEFEYVYSKILNFLSFRPRTTKEVRDRLWKYNLKETSKQNSIIEKLKTHGYLDDLVFARWFIESRNTHRPRSTRMLSQELLSKGIDKETITSLISENSDEKVTISNLLDKKYGAHRKLEALERQKIYAYLGRQGFVWDKIAEVVKSWESE